MDSESNIFNVYVSEGEIVSNKVFIGIMTIIIVGVIGIASRNSSDKSAEMTNSDVFAIQEVDRLLTNPENSKATFIEYSDFQCPACGSYYPLISQAKEEFGDQITFVFRHFPLVNIHPSAMSAHRIAEAANNQGAFVEVHNLLFEQNQIWPNSSNANETIYSLIQQAGIDIDIDQLKTDMASSDTLKSINAQIKSGQGLGVTGTPTFYLDGEVFDFTSYESLQEALNQKIEAADPAEPTDS